MASTLRALRPAASAQRLGGSCLAPIELGQLLRALGSLRRPLLCFRLPPDAVGSAAAGVFRAARQRHAAAAVLVNLAGAPGRALPPTLAALAAAADDARFELPAAVLAEGEPMGAGEGARAAAWVAEAVEAGFPTPVVSVGGPEGPGVAEALAEASSPARERGLGWALSLGSAAGGLAALLGALAKGGAAPVAVRGAGWGPRQRAGDLGGASPWIESDGRELPAEREALAQAGSGLVEIALGGLAPARGDRAEAFAYFAADAALSAWDVEQTGPRAAAALLAAWTE